MQYIAAFGIVGYCLAVEKVRFSGEPVAAVAAVSLARTLLKRSRQKFHHSASSNRFNTR